MPGAEPPRVPAGLRDLMKSLTKEVLREKPPDIYEFSAQYFESMMQDKKDFEFREFEPATTYDAIFRNRERNQVPLSLVYTIIPEGLTELIKEFIKAVLRTNPKNICAFAVEYFRGLQKAKEGKESPSVEYSAYENYFKSKERFSFTPYVKCTCGRTFGEGMVHGHMEKSTTMFSKTSTSVETWKQENIVITNANLQDAHMQRKTVEESSETVEKQSEVHFETSKEEINEIYTKNIPNYGSEEYVKAIFVLQRFFRRLLRARKAKDVSQMTSNNSKDITSIDNSTQLTTLNDSKDIPIIENSKQLSQMSESTAALIIQRTLRTIFNQKRQGQTGIVPKLENINDHNDSASEASTALLSAESTRENAEHSPVVGSEEEIIQKIIHEDIEVEKKNTESNGLSELLHAEKMNQAAIKSSTLAKREIQEKITSISNNSNDSELRESTKTNDNIVEPNTKEFTDISNNENNITKDGEILKENEKNLERTYFDKENEKDTSVHKIEEQALNSEHEIKEMSSQNEEVETGSSFDSNKPTINYDATNESLNQKESFTEEPSEDKNKPGSFKENEGEVQQLITNANGENLNSEESLKEKETEIKEISTTSDGNLNSEESNNKDKLSESFKEEDAEVKQLVTETIEKDAEVKHLNSKTSGENLNLEGVNNNDQPSESLKDKNMEVKQLISETSDVKLNSEEANGDQLSESFKEKDAEVKQLMFENSGETANLEESINDDQLSESDKNKETEIKQLMPKTSGENVNSEESNNDDQLSEPVKNKETEIKQLMSKTSGENVNSEESNNGGQLSESFKENEINQLMHKTSNEHENSEQSKNNDQLSDSFTEKVTKQLVTKTSGENLNSEGANNNDQSTDSFKEIETKVKQLTSNETDKSNNDDQSLDSSIQALTEIKKQTPEKGDEKIVNETLGGKRDNEDDEAQINSENINSAEMTQHLDTEGSVKKTPSNESLEHTDHTEIKDISTENRVQSSLDRKSSENLMKTDEIVQRNKRSTEELEIINESINKSTSEIIQAQENNSANTSQTNGSSDSTKILIEASNDVDKHIVNQSILSDKPEQLIVITNANKEEEITKEVKTSDLSLPELSINIHSDDIVNNTNVEDKENISNADGGNESNQTDNSYPVIENENTEKQNIKVQSSSIENLLNFNETLTEKNFIDNNKENIIEYDADSKGKSISADHESLKTNIVKTEDKNILASNIPNSDNKDSSTTVVLDKENTGGTSLDFSGNKDSIQDMDDNRIKEIESENKIKVKSLSSTEIDKPHSEELNDTVSRKFTEDVKSNESNAIQKDIEKTNILNDEIKKDLFKDDNMITEEMRNGNSSIEKSNEETEIKTEITDVNNDKLTEKSIDSITKDDKTEDILSEENIAKGNASKDDNLVIQQISNEELDDFSNKSRPVEKFDKNTTQTNEESTETTINEITDNNKKDLIKDIFNKHDEEITSADKDQILQQDRDGIVKCKNNLSGTSEDINFDIQTNQVDLEGTSNLYKKSSDELIDVSNNTSNKALKSTNLTLHENEKGEINVKDVPNDNDIEKQTSKDAHDNGDNKLNNDDSNMQSDTKSNDTIAKEILSGDSDSLNTDQEKISTGNVNEKSRAVVDIDDTKILKEDTGDVLETTEQIIDNEITREKSSDPKTVPSENVGTVIEETKLVTDNVETTKDIHSLGDNIHLSDENTLQTGDNQILPDEDSKAISSTLSGSDNTKEEVLKTIIQISDDDKQSGNVSNANKQVSKNDSTKINKQFESENKDTLEDEINRNETNKTSISSDIKVEADKTENNITPIDQLQPNEQDDSTTTSNQINENNTEHSKLDKDFPLDTSKNEISLATNDNDNNPSPDNSIGTQNSHENLKELVESSDNIENQNLHNINNINSTKSNIRKDQNRKLPGRLNEPLIAEIHLKSFRLPEHLESIPWYEALASKEYYSDGKTEDLNEAVISQENHIEIRTTANEDTENNSKKLDDEKVNMSSPQKEPLIPKERAPTYLIGATLPQELPTLPRRIENTSTTFIIPFENEKKKPNKENKNDKISESVLTKQKPNKVQNLQIENTDNDFNDSESQIELESPTKLFAELNEFNSEIDPTLDVTYTVEEANEMLDIGNLTKSTALTDILIQNEDNTDSSQTSTSDKTLQTIIEVNESETPRPESKNEEAKDYNDEVIDSNLIKQTQKDENAESIKNERNKRSIANDDINTIADSTNNNIKAQKPSAPPFEDLTSQSDVVNDFSTLIKAVLIIQKTFRGYLIRKKMQSHSARKHTHTTDVYELTQAAIIIQKAFRGFVIRKQNRQIQNTIPKSNQTSSKDLEHSIRSTGTTVNKTSHVDSLAQAATTIQKYYKGYLARKRKASNKSLTVKSNLAETMLLIQAAIIIQKVFRGYLIRKQKIVRQTTNIENDSSAKLQSQKDDTTHIDVKNMLPSDSDENNKVNFQSMIKAAIIIQNAFRNYNIRKTKLKQLQEPSIDKVAVNIKIKENMSEKIEILTSEHSVTYNDMVSEVNEILENLPSPPTNELNESDDEQSESSEKDTSSMDLSSLAYAGIIIQKSFRSYLVRKKLKHKLHIENENVEEVIAIETNVKEQLINDMFERIEHEESIKELQNDINLKTQYNTESIDEKLTRSNDKHSDNDLTVIQNRAATIIQTAYRNHLSNKTTKSNDSIESTNNDDNSWTESQITAIHIENDAASLQNTDISSIASNEENNNANIDSNDNKVQWFVGTEPIVSSDQLNKTYTITDTINLSSIESSTGDDIAVNNNVNEFGQTTSALALPIANANVVATNVIGSSNNLLVNATPCNELETTNTHSNVSGKIVSAVEGDRNKTDLLNEDENKPKREDSSENVQTDEDVSIHKLTELEGLENKVNLSPEDVMLLETSTLPITSSSIVGIVSDFLNTERAYCNIDKDEGKSIDEINYQAVTDYLNKPTDSDIPYEVLEEPCVKKILPPKDVNPSKENTSGDSSNEMSTNDAISTSIEDNLEIAAEKMQETYKIIEKMQQRRASTAQTNLAEPTREPSFEAPAVTTLQDTHLISTPDTEEESEDVVLKRLTREDTRESSAQSDAVVFGNDDEDQEFEEYDNLRTSMKRVHTIAGDDTKMLVKSVTIDHTIQYIEPTDVETSATSNSSFCLDDTTAENIREKMLAYSMSEADSDYFDPATATSGVDQTKVQHDDFNINTALADITTGSSTETESTIISAATKIQAGARGFLTRRRLRRISGGTKSSVPDDYKASFGNDAINESLERLIEDEAAKKIQKAYRNYTYRTKKIKHATKARTVGSGIRPAHEKQDLRQAASLESSLAARRLTLQRAGALQNDSTPDDENNGKNHNGEKDGTSQARRQSSGAATAIQTGTATATAKAAATTTTTAASSSSVGRGGKPTTVANDRAKRIADSKLKWFGIRQNSMPVQIDSEILRVIPKHMRKRIKSAEGNGGNKTNKKTLRRILKD